MAFQNASLVENGIFWYTYEKPKTMSDTQTTSGLQVPTGTEIYDALMAPIEPELTTSQIPLLETKYQNESEADRAKRLQRYNEAYAKYDVVYTKWISELHALVASIRHDALKTAEADDRSKEAVELSRLESSFVS